MAFITVSCAPSGMLSADLLNTLEIGDDFQDCNDCPVMVVIPPGAYVMGSPEMDFETESDELPQHEVILRRAFAVSQFEVTRAQFSAFILATKRSMAIDCRGHGVDPSVGLNWQSPGFTQTDTHPIVCVNWRDAKDYTEWLSAQTGFHYRLLSESEWEYAARAGANTTRYWGASAEEGCAFANGADESSFGVFPDIKPAECDDGYVFTSPVGSFEKNAFGLYDMIGNVWEWTEDCWSASYVGAAVDNQPRLNGDCQRRILRGGSWDNSPSFLRSASRIRFVATTRMYSSFGFRVARTLK